MKLTIPSRFRSKFWRVPSDPEHSGANQTGSGRRIAFILLSAAIIFLVVEAALQIRSQILSGRSIFNAITGQTRYVIDERTGLKLLRPNQVFADAIVEMRTNSLGLRSPEILPARTTDSLRIVVVGASTVMGIVAATNEDTFSALLESRLRKAFPGRTIEVINAGVADYTLKDERVILERLILPLKPDLVIAYTGVNDFLDYCDGSIRPGKSGTTAQRQGLPVISMPSWLLTVRATSKIATFLRAAPSRPGATRDPYSVDLRPYRAGLEALAKTVLDANTSLLLATNARASRPERPPDEQQRLSLIARFKTPCFDVAGLHALYDLHNAEIHNVGKRMGIPVLPLDERIPGGERYFDDSTHFSSEGEQLVADEIFGFLMAKKLIQF